MHVPLYTQWLKGLFLHYVVSEVFSRVKKVSEYDQEIPQSQTADNPVAPRGRAAQPSISCLCIKTCLKPATLKKTKNWILRPIIT